MDKMRVGIIGVGNMGSLHLSRFFDGKIKEYSCEFTPEELAEHVYFRCTARFGRRQEKLYSQPIMLTEYIKK